MSSPSLQVPSFPISAWQGFILGLRCLIDGIRFVLNRPACWILALVPGLIFVGLSLGLIVIAIHFLEPWVMGWVDMSTSPIASYGAPLLLWSSRIVTGFAAFMLALIAAPILAGSALERLVTQQEQAIGVSERQSKGFFSEMWCGLRAQAFALLVFTPLLVGLWLLEFIVPVSVVVVVPLKLTVVSFGVAWNLLDYPLTLRGIGMRERVRLLKRHPAVVLGFGAGVAALFWCVCGSIVLLPAAVVGATRLVWSIQRGDSTTWPTLAS